MNKAISIAAVIAATALALYFLLGSSDSPNDKAKKNASSSEASKGGQSGEGRPVTNIDVKGMVLPPLRMSGSKSENSSVHPEVAVRTYIRNDGTVVRDHRREDFGENLERGITPPKSVSPVQPETLAAVRVALRPAMNKCIASHAADAPDGSRAQAVLTVSIRSEKLTVDTLEVSTEGLEDGEALKACISGVMLGHSQMVSGAKDADAHKMTFPYNL